MSHFKQQLQQYAELIVAVGGNVQPGQTVMLQIEVEQSELAHLITTAAYQRGAAEVIVNWQDTATQQAFIAHAATERMTTVDQVATAQVNDWLDKAATRIVVMSADPSSLSGLPAERIAAYQQTQAQIKQPLMQALQANRFSWTVVAAAGLDWAHHVFPDLPPNVAVTKLWQLIFKITRIDQPDPIAAWQQHAAELKAYATKLNQLPLDRLHYYSAKTDLTIGLPKNYNWSGATSENSHGQTFMPNMPTEEIFTAPDRYRVDGTVTATKPLSYAGTIIDGMVFTFTNGRITAAHADHGQSALDHLLATDAGAQHLGELALVPEATPIARSGLIFYNTLFDENAANHLAFGSAYPFSIKDGTSMIDAQLKATALNTSQLHVDFMVGAPDMAIDAYTKDDRLIPIFRNGNWVPGLLDQY